MAKRRQHGEGSVFQRKRDGRWVARVELGRKSNGKRDQQEFTGTTPEEAIDKRRVFLRAREDGFTMPKGRPPTVAEWVTHWLENTARPRIAETTYERTYLHQVRDLIAPYFANTLLSELNEEDVERWHAQLGRRPAARGGGTLSRATIVQAHRILSSAIKTAVIRGRLPRNPLQNVPPPRLERERPDLPSALDVIRLKDRCLTWPYGPRWLLAIATGLRQGEVLALEWRDIRLDPPASVRVERAAATVARQRVVKPPKSRSSRRTVPLPPEAVAALRIHRERQQVRDLRGLVFTTAAGQPVSQRADWQDWADLLADLGLPHCGVHAARHVYATTLLEQGIDRRVVQDVMGHSTAALLDIYQDVRPVMHQQVADAISRALEGPR
jgi:integrase